MTGATPLPVIITEAAIADLNSIADYIGKRGADAAVRLVQDLLVRARALNEFPARGARPKELQTSVEGDIRQLNSEQHRIIYEVQDDQVLVLLIADGRRDMQTLLRSRLLER